MKSQSEYLRAAERCAGERDRLFFEIFPTLQPGELAKLVAKRPELWGRYKGFCK